MRRNVLSVVACIALIVQCLTGAGPASAAGRSASTSINPPSCAKKSWLFKAGQDHPFRIWYPDKNSDVAHLATYLRQQMDETIWHKETSLMETQPVANTQDICLVADVGDGQSTGNTLWDLPGCGQKKATILVLNTLDDQTARDVLAHEFMHALQFSLDVGCSDTWWWRESTAQWAEDFVYPGDNREQGFAHHYLSDMTSPINDECDCSKNREYGSYVFPFFIARSYGSDLIRQIWHKAQSESVLDAINDVVPGGLVKQWPRFALDAWNAGPVDYFDQWDGLEDGVWKEFGDAERLNKGDDLPLASGELPHMSAQYFSFKVAPGVRTVALQIGSPYYQLGSSPDKHATVQAIVGLGDGTSEEVKNWSGTAAQNYCLSLPNQDVKTLTIIYANSNESDDFSNTAPSYLVATNIGCAKWHGTVSGEGDFTNGNKVTTTATVTFKRQPSTPADPVFYVPVSGSTTWQGKTKTPDGCTGSGNGSWDVTTDAGYLSMDWNLHNVPGFIPTRGYGGDLGGPLFYTWTYKCPHDAGEHPVAQSFAAMNTGPTSQTVSSDGLTMKESYSDTTSDGTVTWHWTLHSAG